MCACGNIDMSLTIVSNESTNFRIEQHDFDSRG